MTVTTPTGPRRLVTTRTYDANGNVTSVKDAENKVTTFGYDAVGKQNETIDALGRRTEFRYDTQGQLVEIGFESGVSTHFVYDASGQRIASIDRLGRATRIKYGPVAGRPEEMLFPDDTPAADTDNPRIGVEYGTNGQMKALINEHGKRTEFEYDAAGHQTKVRDDLSHVTKTYDAAGREVARTDALGRTTAFVYDEVGRLIETVFHDGTSTKIKYDEVGNRVAETDQAGRTTKFEYDALNRLTVVEDALGQRTEYGYDEAGNLVRQKDANEHETHFEYDGLGRRTAVVRPLGQRSETVYDAVGNVIGTTDFNGVSVTYEYDDNNLLLGKHFPDGTSVEFTYTPTGRRQTVVDGRGTTSYTYDAQDRLLSREDPDGTTITYTYDTAGNVTTVVTPGGVTTYTYADYNRLETVTDPDSGVTNYAYDLAGNLVRTELPNGLVETRQYDDLNRLTFLQNLDGDGNPISSYTYTLDAASNRRAVVEHDGRTVEYDYDRLDRLTSESIFDPIAGNRTIVYTYDPVGNRLSRDDSAQGLTTYTYDENDRLSSETRAGEMNLYTYDNNGNTKSRVKDATDQVFFEWDFENRLIGADVTDAGGTRHITYQYDADGLRVASGVDGEQTRYLIDANRPFAEVLQEYTPDGSVQVSYTHGHDLVSQDRGNQSSYYVHDGHSGVRMLTDASGFVTDRYSYDAYGIILPSLGSTTNHYLYRGEQFDPHIGLQYLRARYYNPHVGHFTSVDPFEGRTDRPISRHGYLYAAGNPIKYTDPSGGSFTLAEVITVVTIITILGSIAQASYSAYQSTIHGDYKWQGTLSEIGVETEDLIGVDVNALFLNLTVDCALTREGYRTAFGSWFLLMQGIEKDPSGFGFLVEDVHISFGPIEMESPRVFGLRHWVFAGFANFLEASVVLGTGYNASILYAGFGRSTNDFLGFNVGSGTGLDISLEAVTGLSIPLPGVWSSYSCTPRPS